MNERQQKILDILTKEGSVNATQLSEQFGCSKVTIRSDIRSLESQDLLIRVHGGAVRKDKKEEISPEYSKTKSLSRCVKEKKQIAADAYRHIKDNEIIVLDDSSSCYFLAEYIRDHSEKRITVVTNSILSANVLAECPHVDLYMIGGHVGGHLPATMGEQANREFMSAHVDKAFIGVHSINFRIGITSIGELQMQMKRSIMKATDKTYVLADHTKFEAGYISVVCPLSAIHKIITDSGIAEKYIRLAEEESIAFEVAGA